MKQESGWDEGTWGQMTANSKIHHESLVLSFKGYCDWNSDFRFQMEAKRYGVNDDDNDDDDDVTTNMQYAEEEEEWCGSQHAVAAGWVLICEELRIIIRRTWEVQVQLQ